jgi:hypothetical protein
VAGEKLRPLQNPHEPHVPTSDDAGFAERGKSPKAEIKTLGQI